MARLMDVDYGSTDFRWRPVKCGRYGWYAEECSIGPLAMNDVPMTRVFDTKAELIEHMNDSSKDGYTRVK
jgi:hypothetical protein